MARQTRAQRRARREAQEQNQAQNKNQQGVTQRARARQAQMRPGAQPVKSQAGAQRREKRVVRRQPALRFVVADHLVLERVRALAVPLLVHFAEGPLLGEDAAARLEAWVSAGLELASTTGWRGEFLAAAFFSAAREALPVLSPADIRRWAARTTAYPTPPGSGNAYARWFLDRILPLGPDIGDFADSGCLAAAPFFGDVVSVPEVVVGYRRHDANDSDLLKDDRRFPRERASEAAAAVLEERKAGSVRRLGREDDPHETRAHPPSCVSHA